MAFPVTTARLTQAARRLSFSVGRTAASTRGASSTCAVVPGACATRVGGVATLDRNATGSSIVRHASRRDRDDPSTSMNDDSTGMGARHWLHHHVPHPLPETRVRWFSAVSGEEEGRDNLRSVPSDRNDEEEMAMVSTTTITGSVKSYNRDKAFGFITPDHHDFGLFKKGGTDIFVHRSAIISPLSPDQSLFHPYLKQGERVRFKVKAYRGNLQATEVTRVSGAPVEPLRKSYLAMNIERARATFGAQAWSIMSDHHHPPPPPPHGTTTATESPDQDPDADRLLLTKLQDAYLFSQSIIDKAKETIVHMGMKVEDFPLTYASGGSGSSSSSSSSSKYGTRGTPQRQQQKRRAVEWTPPTESSLPSAAPDLDQDDIIRNLSPPAPQEHVSASTIESNDANPHVRLVDQTFHEMISDSASALEKPHADHPQVEDSPTIKP